MNLTEELLMAYADGEADAQTRAAIEAAMAKDSAIRERVEAHRRLRGALAGAFGSAMREPAPERLVAAARGASPTRPPAKPAEIVDLAAVRARKAASTVEPAPRRGWVRWSALAACVAIGVILARGLGAVGTAPLIADTHGTLIAQGALSLALDRQIAGAAAAPDQSIKIGVSFRTTDKLYCRTFQVVRGDGLAGLACRAPAGWQVRVTAATPTILPNAKGYRTAASAIPPAISASVDAMIDGSPLDAQAEMAARAKGWRQ
jgi:hypothetical protein